MAKIFEKDPATYSKERDAFLRELQQFHETRGTPFKRSPTVGGKEVDLYLLYTLVTAQGGWLKVNSKNGWPELLQHFNLPAKCVNGSIALKQIYLRYLDRWEKVHFLGEEADRGSDDDEESRHKRWSARSLHSVPLTYNYHIHNVMEANREYNHMSTDLYKPSEYDRLALSLISPLPNEQDFAINVCTLLSNDHKTNIKLEKHPRLVSYLLAHAGVFNHSSLRKLFQHTYTNIRKHSIHNFWHDVLDSKEYLDLIDETSTETESKSKNAEQNSGSIETRLDADSIREELIRDSDIFNCDGDSELLNSKSDGFKFKLEPSDRELFSLGRMLGAHDYLGQRVLQVGMILRNLSFSEDNLSFLANHRTFLRFLLLCSCSGWNYLKNIGLDVLGNVAGELIIKDIQNERIATALLRIISSGLASEDRLWCISSLEILNKLSQNEKNEETLLRCLEPDVYEKVCTFLTLHDVMLLIYTLECLYSLSSLGERSCNLIVNNHGVVDTLVSLVTVEGKSYGPKACIGMRLVETVSGNVHLPNQTSNSSTSNVQTGSTLTNLSSSTSATPKSTSSPLKATASSSKQPNAIQSKSATSSIRPLTNLPMSKPAAPVPVLKPNVSGAANKTPVAPRPVVPVTAQKLQPILPSQATPKIMSSTAATTPASQQPAVSQSQTLTPQQLIQQQHAHQQAIQENEQFALAWLRATYEPWGNNRVNSQELYKHYITSCTKIGRRGVISPLHFPRCVRSVFGGTVGPNPVKLSNPNDQQFYDGIKVRAQPLLINIQPSSNVTVSQSLPQVTGGTTTTAGSRRKSQTTLITSSSTVVPAVSPAHTVVIPDAVDSQPSPASPILKAQLSAPPKPRETGAAAAANADLKSQVMSHPHLSQALLGTAVSTSSSTSMTKEQLTGQTNTSLIKSLLANKVNECMTGASMKTASDCQNVAQVAERQQRLLSQAQPNLNNKTMSSTKINGMRQLFPEEDATDPSVSSTTPFANSTKGKKEPPQPPPPPLAPLSMAMKMKNSRIDNEDSDSVGNNSIASSIGLGAIGVGGVSSTEEGENSLTSFEGLLNGIPNLENPLNEDSNSKDSVNMTTSSNEILRNKPLRLADLLEKRPERTPPLLNGSLGKDLKLGEKVMDLVENHIEKALNRDFEHSENLNNEKTKGLKRPASVEINEVQHKKPLIENNLNGTTPSTSNSNGEERPSTVSNAAAKLFADMAADIMEDEDEEQLLQQQVVPQPPSQIVESAIIPNSVIPHQQIENQVIVQQPPRQIVVAAQPQGIPNVVVASGQIKPTAQQTVIVQNPPHQRQQMVIQQGAGGQLVLSQGLQGQMQLVASATQPGQYLLQTSSSPGAYMVAQSQTAMVHGQPQTVLVAQTPQQQGTATKTIIILQQPPQVQTTHHQKVVLTPQGQQVVVTQVARPLIQSPVANIVPTPSVIKSNIVTPITHTAPKEIQPYIEQKVEEVKPVVIKQKVRDLSTPFVCEWGDCMIERKFRSANEVYLHVCEAHCPRGSEEITCQWDRCDNMKRKRFSLMTHIHDKHCNTEAMRQSLIRRKQSSTHVGKVEPNVPASISPHPGYAPDAALHAIKRHALEFVNPKELQDDNEGPVTKSIRLTASLILRNLVIYSSNCRRYLKPYEPHLANVALSNVESSRTIAQVLYDMNEGTSHNR